MEVYLIRHTETVSEKGICYGQADVTLLTPFEEQFQKIKQELGNETMVFYSSPLQRCLQLAEYLTKDVIAIDKRLMEMHFGNWELQPWDTIPKEELNPWMEDFVSVQVPNGESFEILYERVLSFIVVLFFLFCSFFLASLGLCLLEENIIDDLIPKLVHTSSDPFLRVANTLSQ